MLNKISYLIIENTTNDILIKQTAKKLQIACCEGLSCQHVSVLIACLDQVTDCRRFYMMPVCAGCGVCIRMECVRVYMYGVCACVRCGRWKRVKNL